MDALHIRLHAVQYLLQKLWEKADRYRVCFGVMGGPLADKLMAREYEPLELEERELLRQVRQDYGWTKPPESAGSADGQDGRPGASMGGLP